MDEILGVTRSLLNDLEQFKRLKKIRWEQVEESVQMSNRLGSPTEDWIAPPDEEAVRKILHGDPEYTALKEAITTKIPLVKQAALAKGLDTHHELDWLKFASDPLLGTAALEDAISCLKRLLT